jgi:hypothetical protein
MDKKNVVGWGSGSSGRESAWKARSPKFKSQYHQKINLNK